MHSSRGRCVDEYGQCSNVTRKRTMSSSLITKHVCITFQLTFMLVCCVSRFLFGPIHTICVRVAKAPSNFALIRYHIYWISISVGQQSFFFLHLFSVPYAFDDNGFNFLFIIWSDIGSRVALFFPFEKKGFMPKSYYLFSIRIQLWEKVYEL